MAWFSHLGTEARRFEVELLINTVKYKNLPQPLYVVWERGDKEAKTRPMAGVKGVYDFLDSEGSPPEPQLPLKLECTLYLKKGKYLPKKSKLHLRYRARSGGDELKLGVAELVLSDYLDAAHPAKAVSESITLSFAKSIDKASTISLVLRARWLSGVDVAKLRAEDPSAVSKASGVSAFVGREAHTDDEADEHDPDETPEARRKRQAADAKLVEKSRAPASAAAAAAARSGVEHTDDDDDEEVGTVGIEEFVSPKSAAARAANGAAATAAAAGARSPARATTAAAASKAALSPAQSRAAAASAAATAATNGGEEDAVAVEDDDDEEEESEAERLARRAAKKARREEKARKRAAKLARRAQEDEEEEEEEEEEAETPSAASPPPATGAASAAYAHVLASPNAAASAALAASVPLPAASPTHTPAKSPVAATAVVSASAPSAASAPTPTPAAATVASRTPVASSSPVAAVAAAAAEDDEEDDDSAAAAGVGGTTSADPPADAAEAEDDSDPEDQEDSSTWTNFTGTLPWIMSVQAESDADLDLPLPLHKLLKALRKLGGLETPAIFKQPPSDPALVDSLKSRIEQDIFKLKTSDPAIPAACVKTWLASLARPVVLEHTYDLVLQVGARDDDDEEEEDEEEEPKPAAAAAAAAGQAKYSDLLQGLDGTVAPSSPRRPTVRALLRRIALSLPVIHRRVLLAVVDLVLSLLAPKAARKNGLRLPDLATVFGSLLVRLQQGSKASYDFFMDRQYANKFVEHLCAHREELAATLGEPDVALAPRPRAPRAKRGSLAATQNVVRVWDSPAVAQDHSDLLPSENGDALPAPSKQQQEQEQDYSDLLVAAPSSSAASSAAAAAAATATAPSTSTSTLAVPHPVGHGHGHGHDDATDSENEAGPRYHQPEDSRPSTPPPHAAVVVPTVVDSTVAVAAVTPALADAAAAGADDVAHPVAASAADADAEADPEAEAEAADEVDPEELERIERKRLKKEKKRLKKEKRERQQQQSGTEEDDADDAEVSPLGQGSQPQLHVTVSPAATPLASSVPLAVVESAAAGLTPLHGLTPTKPSAAASSAVGDPFAGVALPASPAAATANKARAASPIESFVVDDDDQDDEDAAEQSRRRAAAARLSARKTRPTDDDGQNQGLANGYDDVLPSVSPVVVVAASPAAKASAETTALRARVEQLESLLAQRDAALADLESQRLHTAQRHEAQVAALEEQLQAATTAAASAASASAAARSSSAESSAPSASPSASPVDGQVRKLTRKLAALEREHDDLLERAEVLAKQVGLLEALSAEKSRAMGVMALQVQAASSSASTAARGQHSRHASSSSLGTDDALLAEDPSTPSSLRVAARGRAVSSSISAVTAALASRDSELRRANEALHAAQESVLSASLQAEAREQDAQERMEASLASLRTELEGQHHAQLEAQAHRLDVLQASLVRSESDRVSAQAALAEVQAALSDSERRVAASEASRLAARAELEALHSRSAQREAALQSEVSSLAAQARSDREALDRSRVALERAQAQLQAVEAELAEKTSKVKELLGAAEKRAMLASPSAAATAAAGRSSRRRAGDAQSDSEEHEDDDEDEASRARRKRKQALARGAGAGSAAPTPSPSASAGAAGELLQLRQVLADKNQLLESSEATEARLRESVASLEAAAAEHLASWEATEADLNSRLLREQARAAELTAALASARRDADDLRKQTAAALATPPGAAAAPASPSGQSAAAAAAAATAAAALANAESTILSLKGRVRELEDSADALRLQLKAAESAAARRTPSAAASGADSARTQQLAEENRRLSEALAAARLASPSASASSAELKEELGHLQGLLARSEEAAKLAAEQHAMHQAQFERDSAAKISALQKFKAALGEKFAVLEAENSELRSRALTFSSLSDALDKKYTDSPAAKKKLDRKEVTLLQAFHEAQRRATFLEGQLRQTEATLAVLKETFQNSQEVFEQELEGLENECDTLKVIYSELKDVMRLGLAGPDGSSGHAVAALTIDWARYEDVKLRLAHSENAQAELSLDIIHLRQALDLKSAELNTMRKKLAVADQDVATMSSDLVRQGITLKTIADDNFEMKEYLRQQASQAKK